jgi:predicted ABC-type ATPase
MKLNKKALSLFFVFLLYSFSAFSQALYDTSDKYTDKNGQYFVDRKSLHKSIFNKYLSQIVRLARKEHPNSIFMAGGPGSGKSYSLESLAKAGVVNLSNYVIINSDDIKEMIPEYQTFKKIDAEKAANMVHKESSFLKDQVVGEATKRKVNFILDGTFSDPVKSAALLKTLTGFQTKIIFVDAPTEVLLKRVQERGQKTGRFVPPDFVKHSVEQIRASIAELSKVADITFFIINADRGMVKEIKWKDGKKLIVNTPIDLLSKKQVNDFKKLMDP